MARTEKQTESSVSSRIAITTSLHALLIAELAVNGAQGARRRQDDNIKLGPREEKSEGVDGNVLSVATMADSVFECIVSAEIMKR